MEFKEAISKLKKSNEFEEFMKKNKEAYLCGAFAVVDFIENKTVLQLNFQLEDEKIASFSINGKIELKVGEMLMKKKMEKLKEGVKIDVEQLIVIVKKQLKEKEEKEKLVKIMAVLSKEEKQEKWNVTCFFDGLHIFNIHIDTDSGKVLKAEKMAVGDFFNKPAGYIG